ncbi:MAG: hypothetical protein KDA84_14580 [Planctomycetaceae bacterium]|nr:hypothetical protein [Planctomycetaceae bacterium]
MLLRVGKEVEEVLLEKNQMIYLIFTLIAAGLFSIAVGVTAAVLEENEPFRKWWEIQHRDPDTGKWSHYEFFFPEYKFDLVDQKILWKPYRKTVITNRIAAEEDALKRAVFQGRSLKVTYKNVRVLEHRQTSIGDVYHAHWQDGEFLD